MRFRWKLGEAFDGDGLPTELIEEAEEAQCLRGCESLPVLFGDGVLI